MPIPAALIALAAGIVPKALRKKPQCLWYYEAPDKPVAQNKEPFSKRQCWKTRAELVRLGLKPENFAILRWGVPAPKRTVK